MSQAPLSDEQALEAYAALQRFGSKRAAAQALGIQRSTMSNRLRIYEERNPQNAEFSIAPIPEDDIDIEDLVNLRIKQFAKKKAYEQATKLIEVKVKISGPIGILHFGDPHVDDDGTDLELLRKHSDLTQIEGVWGANIGDTTNNWVGRLARLYAQQSTSASQAWKLAEWFVARTRWIYMIGGNHDCHDAETEALTKRGWVKYDQIRKDDKVLSFDPETECAVWDDIQSVIVRGHDGEMVDIKCQSLDASVTPNHRILHKSRNWKKQWGDWGYAQAGNLPPRFKVPVSAQIQNEGVALSDDQISLAGWILTDGSIYHKGNSPKITLYQSKDGAEINRLVSALDLTVRKSVRARKIMSVCGRDLVKPPKDQHEWTFNADSSRKILGWLPRKGILPAWTHDLNERQFSILLDALVAGDGTWDGVSPKDKNVAVLHGTEQFLSSVQAVAVMHGWNARLSVAREKDYRLNLCNRSTIQAERGVAVSRREYKGIVWCLTVPHSNFMVRRNGAAHFSGNCWAGAADPLKWIAKQSDTLYKASECRINLAFPNGRSVIVNARHDFSGSSMWNPAHAQMKAAQLGYRDHISVSGHKHCSGYGVIKDGGTGRVCHALQVASYKLYDHYAKEKGFRDQTLSPACMTVINPELEESHPDMIKVFWSPEEGVDFLKWKRGKGS